MVEPSTDWGIQLFGLLIATMLICAGIATMAPAHRYRLFFGAVVVAGLWSINLFLLKELSIRSSAVFILDIFCATIFYFLAKPQLSNEGEVVHRNDWASLVFGIYLIVISLEFVHFVRRFDHYINFPLIAAFFGIALILFWGLFRGFGVLPAIIFLGGVTAVVLLSLNTFVYSLILNQLTVYTVLIVLVSSAKPALKNISTWLRGVAKIIRMRVK